jgi:hypothetical protein
MSELDEKDFFVAASDSKGHSDRVWFRIMPTYMRLVDEILTSKKFPYRTTSDVMRHALKRHVVWLQAQSGVKSPMACLAATEDVLRKEYEVQAFQGILEKINGVIGYHVANGEFGEAARVYIQILAQLDQMPEGYLRDRYMGQLHALYGYVLNKSTKADLTQGGDSDGEGEGD